MFSGTARCTSQTHVVLCFQGLPAVQVRPLCCVFRDYPLFKSEKSTHDIADALLSLKHAVVHPQFAAGPLSPPSPGPMPHLGHHAPGPGAVPFPTAPSPRPQAGPQGIAASCLTQISEKEGTEQVGVIHYDTA